MNFRSFGRLGWKVSEVSFGAWALGGDMWGAQDDKESLMALHRAVDLGVNLIDTAQGYGKGHSEEIIGTFLKERREEIHVTTKIPAKPGSPWPLPLTARSEDFFPAAYIISECEKSLRRLRQDFVDVYQFHTWTSSFNLQDDWYEAVQRLRDEGKVRAIGASVPDTTPECVIGALSLGKIDCVQLIYNIFEQSPRWNLFPVAQQLKTSIIVRVPFDEGALTGKYNENTEFHPGDFRRHYFRGNNLKAVVARVKELRSFKEKRHPDMSLAEYALRFCLSHPAVHTVIPGIRNRRQAESNVAAGDGAWLPADELEELQQFAWRKDFWTEEVQETHSKQNDYEG